MMNERTITKENRNNGLDLLKTICILFIILHHLLIKLTDMRALSSGSFNLLYSRCLFVNSFLVVAVNCFFLISGYFRIKHSNIKMIKLIIELYFIHFLVNLLFIALGYQSISLSLIKACVFPLSKFWFVMVYILLDFISPYINKMLDVMTVNEKKKLIIILTVVYCGYAFLIDNAVFGANRGYSIAFAIYAYILGDFVREINIKRNSNQFLLGYMLLCSLNGIFVYFCTNSERGKMAWLLFSYNNLLIISASVCLLLFFSNCTIHKNILSSVGRYTFYIYIIHSTPIFMDYVVDIIKNVSFIEANTVIGMVALSLISIVIVSLCCIVGFFFSQLSKAILAKMGLKGK